MIFSAHQLLLAALAALTSAAPLAVFGLPLPTGHRQLADVNTTAQPPSPSAPPSPSSERITTSSDGIAVAPPTLPPSPEPTPPPSPILTPPPPPPSDSSSGGDDAGRIAGIVVGGAIILALVGGGCVIMSGTRRQVIMSGYGRLCDCVCYVIMPAGYRTDPRFLWHSSSGTASFSGTGGTGGDVSPERSSAEPSDDGIVMSERARGDSASVVARPNGRADEDCDVE